MSLSDDPHDAPPTRFDEVLAEYMVRQDNGETLDREAFVAAHPDVADELRDYFRACKELDEISSNPSRPLDSSSLRDYELLEEIARGGMGVVYKARQRSLNRLVALKMILTGRLASPADVQRFRTEAEAAASLHHPHIVPIHEIGEDQGRHYFTMELIQGGSLAQRLRDFTGDATKAARLMATVAEAVHYAHQHGILHRDLKPANVLIDNNGEPHVTDFGLARRVEDASELTPTGEIIGTPRYMAPEQAAGHVRRLTVAADVYSLGAILYEVLTGIPPFSGRTPLETLLQVRSRDPLPPSRVVRKVSRDLETICLKCLEKDPQRRYAGAGDLADDLRRFLAHQPIHARPSGLGERWIKLARRRPLHVALGAVVAVAVVALIGLWIGSDIRIRFEYTRKVEALRLTRQAADSMVKAAALWLSDHPSGQLDTSQQTFLNHALALYQGIVREEGDDPGIREQIGLAYFQMGEIQRLLRDEPKSNEAYGWAIFEQSRLCAAFPQEPRYRFQLAESYNWLGELLRLNHRLSEAESWFREALALQSQLTMANPREPDFVWVLARSHYNLGIVEMDTQRWPTAEADFDQAVTLLTGLVENQIRKREYRHELARSSINRGILHKLAGRWGPAYQDYQQTVRLLTELKDEYRSHMTYKLELAVAHNNLGNLLASGGSLEDVPAISAMTLGLPAEPSGYGLLLTVTAPLLKRTRGLEEFARALDLAQRLEFAYPDRPDYRKELANIHNSLGAALYSPVDITETRRHWKMAEVCFRELTTEFPDVPDYQGGLGRSVGNLGLLHALNDDWESAYPKFDEAVTRLRSALKGKAKHGDYAGTYRNNQQSLVESLVRLGRHAEAAEAAHQFATDQHDDPLAIYFAACFLARCVPLTAMSELKERYADQSVQFLRQAIAAGFKDRERLQKDQADIFRWVKDRPEFDDVVRSCRP